MRLRLSWSRRACLALIAIGGSVAYALSFQRLPESQRLAPLAAAVMWSAALSWPIFGGAVLLATRTRPSILDWTDACLRTMAIGMAVLTAGSIANVAALSRFDAGRFLGCPELLLTLWIHLMLLLAAQVFMAVSFLHEAAQLRLSTLWAILLWIAGLCGPFAFWLWLIASQGTIGCL
jgi:hypothetical protein